LKWWDSWRYTSPAPKPEGFGLRLRAKRIKSREIGHHPNRWPARGPAQEEERSKREFRLKSRLKAIGRFEFGVYLAVLRPAVKEVVGSTE
jgi:hypothetical protein